MTNTITLDEIINRGLELPYEKMTFFVEEYEESKAELQDEGGIYTFHHRQEGFFYVGVAQNMWRQVYKHINGQGGNEQLYEKIHELEDVIVTTYFEENPYNRDIYQAYILLTEEPKYNAKIVSPKGKKLTKKEQQEQEEREYSFKVFDLANRYKRGEIDLQEVAEELDVTELRAKYLISPWVGYDD